MPLKRILEAVQAARIHPILVSNIHDDDSDMNFEGTLSEFIEALGALETKTVFVGSFHIDESFFTYLPEDGDEIDNGEDEPFDLCAFEPALGTFKKRVGEIFRVEVYVLLTSGGLKYAEDASWFAPLAQLLANAEDAIDQDREAAIERQEAEEEATAAHLFEDLRGLIDDKTFLKLRTQAAMREYALERFPQLQLVSNAALKQEIQQLVAKIDAKGLNKK